MGKIRDLIKKILINANNNPSNTHHPIPSTEIEHVDVRFSLSEKVPITRIAHIENLKFIRTQSKDKEYLSEIVITISIVRSYDNV